MRPGYIQVFASAYNGKKVVVGLKSISISGQCIVQFSVNGSVVKQKPFISPDRILRGKGKALVILSADKVLLLDKMEFQ